MKNTIMVDNESDEVIGITIKCGNKIVYKEKCSINNKKQLGKIFNSIKFKYGLDVSQILENSENRDWFY